MSDGTSNLGAFRRLENLLNARTYGMNGVLFVIKTKRMQRIRRSHFTKKIKTKWSKEHRYYGRDTLRTTNLYVFERIAELSRSTKNTKIIRRMKSGRYFDRNISRSFISRTKI